MLKSAIINVVKSLSLTVTALVLFGVQVARAETSSRQVVLWNCPLNQVSEIRVEANAIGNGISLDKNLTTVEQIVDGKVVNHATGRYWMESVERSEAAAVFQGRHVIFTVSNSDGNLADHPITAFIGFARFSQGGPRITFECNPAK